MLYAYDPSNKPFHQGRYEYAKLGFRLPAKNTYAINNLTVSL